MNLKDGCKGIDIYHGDKVNFVSLKTEFVFVKATEGQSFISPKCREYCSQLKVKGIPFGTYHFFKAGISPLLQAKNFCQYIDGDLPPVLDIEEMNGQPKIEVQHEMKVFLDSVELFCGKVPIIYSGYSFIKNLNLDPIFARYPLWLAWYTKPEKVHAPAPWKDWTFWQYSDSGTVPGVGNGCDVNIYKAPVSH